MQRRIHGAKRRLQSQADGEAAHRSKRLRFTDAKRRLLAERESRSDELLAEMASLATPETILRGYGERVAAKYEGSRARGAPGRPPRDGYKLHPRERGSCGSPIVVVQSAKHSDWLDRFDHLRRAGERLLQCDRSRRATEAARRRISEGSRTHGRRVRPLRRSPQSPMALPVSLIVTTHGLYVCRVEPPVGVVPPAADGAARGVDVTVTLTAALIENVHARVFDPAKD